MKRVIITATLFSVLLGGCARLPRPEGCPSVEALRDYRPPEATRLYAMDGSLLADLSPERRVVVDLAEVPPAISNGFVAVEDRRFWTHRGIDPRGVIRAVWVNLRTLSLQEGFSTISMQLPRNIFPDELPRRDRFRRKLCELRLAGEIEATLGKRDVLQLYINQVYLGDGKYGVEEASRAYFGKPAARLTTAEAATLVGLVKNPEGYNPRRAPNRAIQRRNTVLDVMAREHAISPADAEAAKAEPLRLAPPMEASGPAPYYVAAARRELRDRFGDDADVRGLRVFTGLDPALQRAAREALVEQIRRVENGSLGRWPHPKPDGDRLAPADGSGSPYLQGAIVVMDTRTGEVRALVGGRDFTHSSYDRALVARRQPGSTFKPIVYAAALQNGLATTDRIETTPVAVDVAGTAWRPDDLVPDSVTSLTVREALALSSNNAAVRVGEWVGVGKVSGMARTLGLSTPVPHYPSVFLGSAEVIPAELAAAYATLGNGGYRVQPRLISRVEDARGNVLWRPPQNPQHVLDTGVAYLATNLMEEVVDRGTGAAVRREGFWLSAAGKTGTTNQAKDVWFVGMTPDLAAAVWFGFDQPKQVLPSAFGGNMAAPVWARTMMAAYSTRPTPRAWTPPASLVSMPVDIRTGGAATDDCPPGDIRIEHFVPGTEPASYCPTHFSSPGVVDRLLRGLRLRGGG
ncbi:MAG TPA: PBP1A family penicillin-binding protein [Longimicrobiales bacterium]|nr:PBP1A family penicillin-binding protein [Longimicrobiales bacterium]